MTALLWILAVALIVVGFLGIVLPALPGTVLVFAGLWLAAWLDGYSRVGVGTLVLIAILGAATYVVDVAAVGIGTKRFGASRRAVAGATLGMLAGLFFGLPGVIIGPFVGALLGELTVHRDLVKAGRAGLAAWIGFVVGTAVKVGLAVAMVGIFVTAWFVF